jgi:hypothetical protein
LSIFIDIVQCEYRWPSSAIFMSPQAPRIDTRNSPHQSGNQLALQDKPQSFLLVTSFSISLSSSRSATIRFREPFSSSNSRSALSRSA